MHHEKQADQSPDKVEGNLLKLGGLALLVGGTVGLVGAAFRLALLQADVLRDWLVTHAQDAA